MRDRKASEHTGVVNWNCTHMGAANKSTSLVVKVEDCTHMGVANLHRVGI
jgi:hypothetical protein